MKKGIYHPTLLALFLLMFTLSSCGSEGTFNKFAATPQPANVVAGVVQAPNGQLAFNRKPSLLQEIQEALFPSAFAGISGLVNVADGTIVELVRIDGNANILASISTTTTTGGAYSFDLDSLGVTYSSDLLVQVTSPIGVKMRAIAYGNGVNINPVSEGVFRLILTNINNTQGATLANLTPQEVLIISAVADILTNQANSASTPNLISTLSGTYNQLQNDQTLASVFPTVLKPGNNPTNLSDYGNYFPLVQGMEWNYDVTGSIDGVPFTPYTTKLVVAGTKNTNTTTLHTLDEITSIGTTSQSLVENNNGAIYDWLPNGNMRERKRYQLPFSVGSSFAINVGNKSFGDVDGDGIEDFGKVDTDVKVIALEKTRVVSGITFRDVFHVQTQIIQNYGVSSTSEVITHTKTLEEWFAPDMGMIENIKSEVKISDRDGQLLSSVVMQTIAPSQASVVPTRRQGIPLNKLVANPITNALYGTVPSNIVDQNSGSLVLLDPVNLLVMRALFLGNEPHAMAITDDGLSMYVVLRGTGDIVKVDLATFTEISRFNPGRNQFGSILLSSDIEVVPGAPNSIVIAFFNGDLKIYDNGVERAGTLNGMSQVCFQPNVPQKLYGLTFNAVEEITVNATGLVLAGVARAVAPTLNREEMICRNNLIYLGDGTVFNVGAGANPQPFLAPTTFGPDNHYAIDPSQNLAYFMTNSDTIHVYDLTTKVSTGRIKVTGLPSSAKMFELVPLGASGLAVRSRSAHTGEEPTGQLDLIAMFSIPTKPGDFIPSSVPQGQLPLKISLPTATTGQLPLLSFEIASNPVTNELYASVSTSVTAPNVNSVVTIDPINSTVLRVLPLGGTPGKLAVSSDGLILYAGLNTGEIVQIDVTTFTIAGRFNVGFDQLQNPLLIGDLETIPGSPLSLAVARQESGTFKPHSVAIFDSGVIRPVTLPALTATTRKLCIPANAPQKMYASTEAAPGFDLHTFSIAANGITMVGSSPKLMRGLNYCDATRAYGGYGSIADPLTGNLAGIFLFPGHQTISESAFDPVKNRAYFINKHNGQKVFVYELSTGKLLGVVPFVNPSPITHETYGIQSVGANGIAINMVNVFNPNGPSGYILTVPEINLP